LEYRADDADPGAQKSIEYCLARAAAIITTTSSECVGLYQKALGLES